MLISVGGVKGSSGTSTAAAAIAMAVARRQGSAVLVEADCDGGVMAARWHGSTGVSWVPGLVEFSASRNVGADVALAEVAQPIGGGVGLVAALPQRRAVEAALNGVRPNRWDELARSKQVVVVDVGRLRSPAWVVGSRSVVTLLVAGRSSEDAQLLGPVVSEGSEHGLKVGLLLVGDGPYSVGEIAAAAGVEDLWQWSWPVDKRGAERLWSNGPSGRALAKSGLVRSAVAVTDDVLGRFEPSFAAEAKVEPVSLESGAGDSTVMPVPPIPPPEMRLPAVGFGEVAS